MSEESWHPGKTACHLLLLHSFILLDFIFLSAVFVLKTRTKYWDLVEYPANRKHMQRIKILDEGR